MNIKVFKKKAKSIFVKTKLPGCDWVVNQYVGCQHACKYCYAKFMCKWKGYGKWGSWVEVKVNAPELVRDRYVKGCVYMSSISDPYQPLEAELKLTRSILKNTDKRISLSIQTKSKLVLRDVDLFKQFKDVEVGLTINGFEGKLKHEIEPFSSTHSKRIDALKELRENSIRNYAFISPVIPGLVDVKTLIDETKSFVDFYWIEILNVRGAGKEFIAWLKNNFIDSYEKLVVFEKRKEFIKDILKVVKKERVRVRGVVVHPGFAMLK